PLRSLLRVHIESSCLGSRLVVIRRDAPTSPGDPTVGRVYPTAARDFCVVAAAASPRERRSGVGKIGSRDRPGSASEALAARVAEPRGCGAEDVEGVAKGGVESERVRGVQVPLDLADGIE